MRTAVVVGAGIGGLAAAGALARTGWKVTLLERDDRSRAGRTAYVLWPNGVRALHLLGLAGGLDGIATPMAPPGMRRSDGRWLAEPAPTSHSASNGAFGRSVVVHPDDLHDALVAGLGDRVDIRTGIEVKAARSGPDRPAVTDGVVMFEADLVVAADGARSAVRRSLAPASKLITAGHAAWRALIPGYRAPQLPEGTPDAGEVFGVGHRFSYASLGVRSASGGASRGGVYWVATVPGAARPEPAETQLALLRRWFAGWPQPVAALLDATEPDDLVTDGVGELDPLPASFGYPVGAGGYVLLGDAAHAMAHHLAQGACLALEDAATLLSVVAPAAPGRPTEAALREYGKLRRARAAAVISQSRLVAGMLRPPGRFALLPRAGALGRLAPRLLDRASSAASDWQPPR